MKRLLIILAIFINTNLFCQQIPLLKEYLVNNYYISPAYTGFNGGFEVFFLARKNLIGQIDAPEINKISVNGSPIMFKVNCKNQQGIDNSKIFILTRLNNRNNYIR